MCYSLLKQLIRFNHSQSDHCCPFLVNTLTPSCKTTRQCNESEFNSKYFSTPRKFGQVHVPDYGNNKRSPFPAHDTKLRSKFDVE